MRVTVTSEMTLTMKIHYLKTRRLEWRVISENMARMFCTTRIPDRHPNRSLSLPRCNHRNGSVVLQPTLPVPTTACRWTQIQKNGEMSLFIRLLCFVKCVAFQK